MNGESFYQTFKDILDVLGVSWRDKNLIKVTFSDNKINFEYQGKIISVGESME